MGSLAWTHQHATLTQAPTVEYGSSSSRDHLMEPDLAKGAMWYAAFVASTVCHEAAHARSALHLGDDTAARGGQNTLNPIPHIRREPIGMIVVPIMSWISSGWIIGWASAPYNREWAQENPRKAALMALAGPGTNLAIALGAGLCIRLGYEWGLLGRPSFSSMTDIATTGHGGAFEVVAQFLGIFFSLNLLLCIFNLVPVPPLDGGSAPLLLLSGETARTYGEFTRNPLFRMAGLFIAWKVFPLFFPQVLHAALRLVYA